MSLVNTLLNPLRAEYQARFDKYEQRASRYGAWEAFIQDTQNSAGIWSEDVKMKIEDSFGRQGGVQVPVIDGETVTIGNTRSCTIADDENVSQLVTVTFQSYVWGFTMYPMQHYQNSIDYQADFDRKMKKYLTQLAIEWDNAAIAQLEADKNQFYTTEITNIYPELADALRVPQAEKNDLYNNAETIEQLQDFYGPDYLVIASTAHQPLIQRLINQGSANATNEQFQFGPYRFYYTNRIANGVGVESTAYVVNEGSLAVMNRNDQASRAGLTAADGHRWEEVALPMIMGPRGGNITVGSLYFSTCADAVAALGTAFGGQSEADLKELFIFSTDLAFATAYNSDRVNTHSPIQKYEVLQ